MSSVSISYIFNSDRNLSEEQAIELTEFLGLTQAEADYFLILVQLARAGSKKLEHHLERQLQALKTKATHLKFRLPTHQSLDEKAEAKFYSNWFFSGVRLLTSIHGYQEIEKIAEHLNLPRARVREVVDFLLEYNLCVQEKGKIKMGPCRTHVDAKSSLVGAHHRNWRQKGMERYDHTYEEDFFFTGPMTISHETYRAIRKDLVDLVAQIAKSVEPSKSEVLACINFDLFKVTP